MTDRSGVKHRAGSTVLPAGRHFVGGEDRVRRAWRCLRPAAAGGLIAAIVLVVGGAPVPAAGAPPGAGGAIAREQRLALPGRATATIVRDLDGDGRLDVLVAASRRPTEVAIGAPRRVIALFLQRADGSFGRSGAPDQLLAPDVRAVIFSVADLLPSPGLELIEVTPEAVHARRLDPRRRRYDLRRTELVESASFFLGARTDRIPFWDGAVELGGVASPAPRHSLLLPERRRYVLLEPTPGADDPVKRIRIDPRLPERTAAARPGAAAGDDGDDDEDDDDGPGRIDVDPESSVKAPSGVLVAVKRSLDRAIPVSLRGDDRRDRVRVSGYLVRYRPGGELSAVALPEATDPADAGGGDDTDEEEEKKKKKASRPHVLYRDLDGDDRADPIAFYPIGTGSNEELVRGLEAGEGSCVVRAFLGPREVAPGRSRLAGILRLKGVGVRLGFADVDLDGRLDLVVASFGAGALASLSESFFDRVTVELRAYRIDLDRETVVKTPIVSTSVTLDREDGQLRGGAIDCARLGHDLDGDGRTDAVVFEQRKVSVWAGRVVKTGLFGWFGDEEHSFDDGDPLVELELGTAQLGPPTVADLDGDGAADLVATAGDVVHVVTGIGGAR